MHLWDDNEWSVYCKMADHAAVKEALEGRGFKVEGFINGRPQLRQESIDWEEIQNIITQTLSGSVVLKPSPQKTKPPAAEKKAPAKKPAAKKATGGKKK